MRREFPRAKFIAAFFLTAFIFLLIITTNNYFNQAKLNQLNALYNNIRIDTLNAEVQYEILSENPCISLNFDPIGDELFKLGEKLTSMESDLGKSNIQVLDLKRYYSILEVRQYLFVKKASKQCNKNATPILFFYSNENDCKDCDSQGFVLNYVRNALPGVYVYSFDNNLNSSPINALKISNNITQVPSIVINGKTYSGFRDSDKVIEYIKNK